MKAKLKLAATVVAETILTVAVISVVSMLAPKVHQTVLRKYVSSKVVLLTKEDPLKYPEQGGGTGFHVTGASGKTYILTNRHVCDVAKDKTIWARVVNKTGNHKLNIIERSDNSDLCLVEGIPGVPGLSVGKSLSIGQTIAYLGHPRLQPRTFTMGEAVGEDTVTIFAGIIGKDITKAQCQTQDSLIKKIPKFFLVGNSSGPGDFLKELIDLLLKPEGKGIAMAEVCYQRNKALVTTLMIYPGASGSPVIDFFGNVVGVVYAGPKTGGWGYAVTLADVKKILKGK